MSVPALKSAYDFAFQRSPIILHGGIVAGALGGVMPIIGLVGQLAGFGINALSNGLGMDDFYAVFQPIPGSTVISNAIGMYPFANQQVAANAIIEQPLNISLQMDAPVRSTGGYIAKLAIFTALRNSLQAHNDSGGTYHIATPSYIYTDCVMTGMTDITSGTTKQQGVKWQLDFIRPLITQQAASVAMNALMSKINSFSQVTSPTWSGPLTAAGTALQGAAPGVGGMVGAVNAFLAAPGVPL